MKISVVINTPTAFHTEVDWPTGAAHPAAGDAVLFRRDQVTWAFQVTIRQLAIGVDPRSGEPVCQLLLQVDAEAPTGFRM